MMRSAGLPVLIAETIPDGTGCTTIFIQEPMPQPRQGRGKRSVGRLRPGRAGGT